MSVEAPHHGSTILWCLRHYSWVLIACLLAGAAAPLLLAPATAKYEAEQRQMANIKAGAHDVSWVDKQLRDMKCEGVG